METFFTKDKNFYKVFFRLMLVVALQNLVAYSVNMLDNMMLGSYDQNALSGAATVNQIFFVVNQLAIAIGNALIVMSSQYWGKKDTYAIRKLTGIVLIFSLLAAMIILVICSAFPEQLLGLFTTSPDIIMEGQTYLKILKWTFVLFLISNLLISMLRSVETVQISFVVSVISLIVNGGINYTLIFGHFGFPEMGIKGAALATVLATVVQFLWSVGYVLCRIRAVKFSLRSCEKKLFGRFWQKTVPLLINNLAWGIGFSMYSVIMGHLGTDAVAANGIANISKNLVVCFCLGLGNAGSIIVGNRLGADRLQEAKEVGETLTKTAIIAGIVSGLVLIALSPFITKMVDLTPTARGYLQKMLLISSYYIAGKSVNCMTIGGIFAAGGDSKFGMLCDSVTLWCIIVPLGCICAFILKLPVMVVYFVLNLDEIIKLPVVYKHYKKYKWIKNLT